MEESEKKQMNDIVEESEMYEKLASTELDLDELKTGMVVSTQLYLDGETKAAENIHLMGILMAYNKGRLDAYRSMNNKLKNN